VHYIKSYSGYLTEAYASDYSRKRYFERVGNIGDIAISPDLIRSLKAHGLEFAKIKLELIDLITDRLKLRLDSIYKTQYSSALIAIPVLAVKLWIGTDSDYIKIYTKSLVYKKDPAGNYIKDENNELIPVKEQVHIGEKFYMPVAIDYIKTLLLYPISKSEEAIENSMKDHAIRKGHDYNKIKVMPLTDQQTFNIEVLEDGTIQEKKFTTADGFIDYSADQQWTVAKGRKIKVSVMLPTIDAEKSTSEKPVYVIDQTTGKPVTSLETVEATIDELIQPTVTQISTVGKKSKVTWPGPEKLIKLKLNIGRPIPVIKTIKADDNIWLPIGQNGELIKCKVLSPTYLIDERSANPVNLRFKAIR
jgi:hypothetical protein